MRTTRRMGLALGMTALFGMVGSLGCAGGGAEMAAPASPPGQPMGPSAQSTPSPAGYGDSGGYAPQASSPAPPPPPASAPRMEVQDHKESRGPSRSEAPADRPGLGTQWGETRNSRISTVSFQRADVSSPFATAALFYNDEEGARAMTASSGFRRTPSGSFSIANGLVSVGLRDESSRFFGGFISGGRDYVVGESGHRYTIVVRNNTNFRLEIVMSVDGLDVLDGKAASFGKRGYLVDPRGEVEVDGFRQSMDTVAAFRFGSVRGSYAGQKTGDTRNVGVIGVAVFNEQGTNPVPWTPGEVQQRRDANPFPGQFATPP